MTAFDDFQIKLKRKTLFSIYWYYTISVFAIALAIFLVWGLIKQIDKFGWGHVFLYFIAAFFLSLGIAGFYLIPNRYKIVIVDSNLDIERKKHVVEKILDRYKIPIDFEEEQYVSFTFRTGFWRIPYTIDLFFDEARFAFTLRVRDYADGGFLDFGRSEAKRKEIEKQIQSLSNESSSICQAR